MGLINYSSIEDGTTIDAADVNTPLTTIYDAFNGNIDANNLADNAVTNAKLGLTVSSQTNAGTAGGTMYYINLGGIKLLWGTTNALANVSGVNSYGLTFPSGFFSSTPKILAFINQVTVDQAQECAGQNPSASSAQINVYSGSTDATATVGYFVIGS